MDLIESEFTTFLIKNATHTGRLATPEKAVNWQAFVTSKYNKNTLCNYHGLFKQIQLFGVYNSLQTILYHLSARNNGD